MKFYEVFKAGKYPQGKFTKEQVKELASNYDPTFCEAPITLDHEQAGPAYGWVEKLSEENGVLKASFKDVTEELKTFVSEGKYKKISVEIYRELENKKPYLKAVSFLGASIPQVKGMKAVEFKEGESDVYTFEVEIENTHEDVIASLKTQITSLEKQVAKFTTGKAANEEIQTLRARVAELTDELKMNQGQAIDKANIESELAQLKAKVTHGEFETFVDKQIEAGILTPANKDMVIKILKSLDNVKTFDEKSDALDDFKSFISTLPKQVEFEEIAKKGKGCKPPKEVDEFEDASEESLEIYKEAKTLAEAEKIDFKEALLKVNKEKA